jgi:type IV pilus assembly protein PilB
MILRDEHTPSAVTPVEFGETDLEAWSPRQSAKDIGDVSPGNGLRLEDGHPRTSRSENEAEPSGPLSDQDHAYWLAERHRLPLVDLGITGVSPEAAKLIPLRVLERVGAIPYELDDEGVLRVAISDPENLHAIDELRLVARHPIEFGLAAAEEIEVEVRRLARASVALGAMLEDHAFEPDEGDDLDADDGVTDGPIVRLVNSMLFQAAEEGASDVHVEPQEDGLLIRYRVDGVLRVVQQLPRSLMRGVVTRLKVLAKLDIAERRKPQDGRISVNAAAAGRLLDVRVATLPTVEGESVVLRLLDKSREAPTLEALGLSDEMRGQVASIVGRSTGALLVTGPTGSGKSTTLYAGLAAISRPEINVITVEDPVEYRLAGISQVQINPRAGLTFATALRSILRSDPDVVMVGEIRDVETAKISIEAALTGHFVLSTLHTNDAPGAMTRLNEMGIEPFLTASAVTGVLAQRLTRRLCQHCAEEFVPSAAELAAARFPEELVSGPIDFTLRKARGCTRCRSTGYRGRVGVFQLLRMTEAVEALVARSATREEIERVARAEGMRSLWEDGLAKARAGVTTLEELARVVV